MNEECVLKFKRMCSAYPEQYNVYYKKEKIAYVKLKYGCLTCNILIFRNKEIYKNKKIYYHKFNDDFKEEFDNKEEREKYFEIIKKKIKVEIKELLEANK